MKTYYWEAPYDPLEINPDHGTFRAENDDKALLLMPKNAFHMYKESDTDDGLPFIEVYMLK